jgi:hypothetical protein
VRPAQPSTQLGATLLRRVLPQDESVHCTFSSTDPRALALYIWVGMRPQWPHFNLRLDGPLRIDLPAVHVEIVEAPTTRSWRGGMPDRRPAAACVLAAMRWARVRADVLLIDVPGPHPCLALLLDAGFRIVYVETFVSTAGTLFFDARCCVASGSNLG